MGLGTTKKKLVVFTAVQRMLEDAAITESSKAAIMRYLIENDGKTSASLNDKTIPDYLIEAAQNSIPLNSIKPITMLIQVVMPMVYLLQTM